jgi:hypothetical protein
MMMPPESGGAEEAVWLRTVTGGKASGRLCDELVELFDYLVHTDRVHDGAGL